MAATDHTTILVKLGNAHEDRIIDILKQLEDKIVAITLASPVEDKNLYDLAWAIKARSKIEQAVRETFLVEADSLIREYDEIIASNAEVFKEVGETFTLSDEIITSLKQVSFQGFQDIGSRFADELANELYQNTLTGRPKAESIKSLQQKINGVFIKSRERGKKQEEIDRLVEIAKGEGADAEEAASELRRVYATDRTGNNMRKYASQMVRDTLHQFDASVNVAAAKEVGIKKWRYTGSNVVDSRDWCVEHAGKIYTEEEIRELWANNSWQGKAAGDPFIVRGGYNCRHRWRPVSERDDA
jgi:hypothetical protein